MGQLIHLAITSLDGYIDDADGGFGWAEPDAEVHRFVNDLQHGVGTQLLGRRSYEVMAVWDVLGTDDPDGAIEDDDPAMVEAMRTFADLWRAMDKVVYSTTLDETTTLRSRLERSFDPAAVRRLKDGSELDLAIGGADLAGQALAHGLVDEIQLIVNPAIVGGGTRALPDGVRLDLDLLDQHRFGNGATFLRYRCR